MDIDPCGHELNAVVARRRVLTSEGGDGLSEDWSVRLAFVNPPFSAPLTWLRRTHDQWSAGNIATAICLVPVRTVIAWFHDTLNAAAELYLLHAACASSTQGARASIRPSR